ncbi:MAG: hypothetical protein AABX28_01560 [Nanoarchaeota archaeon]
MAKRQMNPEPLVVEEEREKIVETEPENLPPIQDFIYIPSTKLYVARKKTLQDKSWYEAHEILQGQGSRMQTLPEFIEFLKYVNRNHPDIYHEIVNRPGKMEWIDAYFEQRKDGMYVLTYNRTNAEKLDANTLVDNNRKVLEKISLDTWLKNPTGQGLPRKNVAKTGRSLVYFYPRNGFVVDFDTFCGILTLHCTAFPYNEDSSSGVHAVKQYKQDSTGGNRK